MEKIFLALLEISTASAAVILVITLLSSLINRNFTAKWKYWFWMVLAVRLLIPFNFSFESAPARVEVSIPTAPITLPAAPVTPTPPIQPAEPMPVPIQPAQPVAPVITMVQLLILVWLAGMILFLLWQAVGYLRFRRQVIRWGLPVPKGDMICTVLQQAEAELKINGDVPVLICKEVSSPMMIGFFRPLLILPHGEYNAQDLSYILRHELTHYKRRDIWYKALMLIACAVHWFNPAVWLMVREASRDLEISCDAAVMRDADMEERRQYSETILACIHRELRIKTALSTHFYGGKKTLKERFANILSTKKRRTGAIAFAVVLLCGGIVGGLVACSMQDETPTDEEVIALLQRAEAICQPGNPEVLSIAQYEVMIGDLYYDEVAGYEDAVAELFTEEGAAQLEQAELLGGPLFLRQEGKVYRASAMTDSAATIYYGDIQSVELAEQQDGRFTYNIHHISQPRWGEGETMTSPLVVVAEGGSYRIENFVYPPRHESYANVPEAEAEPDEIDLYNEGLRENYQKLMDNQEMVLAALNEKLRRHQLGTFEPMENHHEDWPADFPDPRWITSPIKETDYVLYLVLFERIDESSYMEGSLDIWVKLQEGYWMVLEPNWFSSNEEEEPVFGFGNSGFYQGAPPFDFDTLQVAQMAERAETEILIENLFTGEQRNINLNAEIQAFQALFSGVWTDGTSDCLSDFKISIGNVDYLYHSDCGTFNDSRNNRSLSLEEEQRVKINQTIAAQGVNDGVVPAMQPGIVYPLGSTEVSSFPMQRTEGRQPELERWNAFIHSDEISRFDARIMSDAGGAISPQNAQRILQVLRGAQLTTFENMGNPHTGGSMELIAYDAGGSELFHCIYDQYWFSVQFANEDEAYVFDGTVIGWDELSALLDVGQPLDTINAKLTIDRILETLILGAEGSLSFVIPTDLPVPPTATDLYITLNLTYDQGGSYRVENLLDMAAGWQRGQMYTANWSPAEGERLTRVMLRAAYMTELGDGQYREFSADYVELTEPLPFGQYAAQPGTQLTTDGNITKISYTAANGQVTRIDMTLPQGITLENSNDGQPVFPVSKDGVTVGNAALHHYGTTDQFALLSVNTQSETPPMQIYSPIALSNHADYTNGYRVVDFTDNASRAVCRMRYQDLTNHGGEAPNAPWLEQDVILSFDLEDNPVFIAIHLQPDILSAQELERWALRITFDS